jgi:hypothetical protein
MSAIEIVCSEAAAAITIGCVSSARFTTTRAAGVHISWAKEAGFELVHVDAYHPHYFTGGGNLGRQAGSVDARSQLLRRAAPDRPVRGTMTFAHTIEQHQTR